VSLVAYRWLHTGTEGLSPFDDFVIGKGKCKMGLWVSYDSRNQVIYYPPNAILHVFVKHY
jgi:hypothetical protein